jgi:hypothetical protein
MVRKNMRAFRKGSLYTLRLQTMPAILVQQRLTTIPCIPSFPPLLDPAKM